MARKILTALCAALLWCGVLEAVDVKIDPGKVLHRIDEKVYGHFLEHIYHSCNGGLWGELVWNRSFEENNAGRWVVRDGGVEQKSLSTNQRLTFGDASWSDYEYTLQARKTGGAEGFLVLFRVRSEKDFYWCNLGGWGNDHHSLERGRASESRWHAVGPQVKGRIEEGRWYRIKVRCEGPRIRVWLDDRLLIDFTDPQGHRRGMVGVGTWSTTARYRNLKVAALDGKVLFEGLPSKLARPSAAKHWNTFGEGEVFLDSRKPLNCRFSQRIVGKGRETGVEQGPFCVGQGMVCAGSLWARGAAQSGLVARLTAGGKTIAEAELPAPAAAWREYPFVLKAAAAASDAVLQVGLRGKGEVWIDQVSLMPRKWAAAGGFRPDLLEAVRALRPPVIRWPGGCFASAYRWKDGIGPQHRRRVYPLEIWDDRDVNSFGTDEFVAMCRKVGAEPLIVVNIGTRNWNAGAQDNDFLQEVLDWIEYCNGPADSKWGKVRAAGGHAEPYRVRYWEIDNETWHMGAERYAGAVRKFAPAMKRADPSIKLAACGSAGYGAGGLAWNRTIIDRCADLVDYLSIHHYENPDRFADGPRAYERFFRQTGDLIARSKNPSLKIDVSEWNAQSTDWRTGLYCGGLLNAFERSGDILEIGGPALFLRHVSAGAWDNAFINFDQCAWFPAPNYVVMKLWRDHYAPARIAAEGDCAPLNAVATRSSDGNTLYYKAVNPSRDAVKVSLRIAGAFRIRGASLELVAPGSLRARNSLEAPRAVKPAAADVVVDGQAVRFEMPPFSAAVAAVERIR